MARECFLGAGVNDDCARFAVRLIQQIDEAHAGAVAGQLAGGGQANGAGPDDQDIPVVPAVSFWRGHLVFLGIVVFMSGRGAGKVRGGPG
jgi:hypothetical protein